MGGPFFFAIGYHLALLETQAAHPDVAIWAYLDDTYYLQEPESALAAMRTGTERTLAVCAVASNLKKQEAFSFGPSLGIPEGTKYKIRIYYFGAPKPPPE